MFWEVNLTFWDFLYVYLVSPYKSIKSDKIMKGRSSFAVERRGLLSFFTIPPRMITVSLD